MIRLTDEENPYKENLKYPIGGERAEEGRQKLIFAAGVYADGAKAQLKKVVEWLDKEALEDCHEGYSNVMCFHRRARQALLGEINETN